MVAVEGHDLLRVLVELRLLKRAAVAERAGDPVPQVHGVLETGTLLVVLQLTLERAVAHRLVADEIELPDLHLRTFVHVKRQVHQLRAAGNLLDLGRDARELKALLLHHVQDDALNLAHQSGIDEGVEPNLRVSLLQLLVDLRRLDFLRAEVVDDLDALPLLQVVGDDLADRAVGELVVADVDPQVVEELRVPQPVKVFFERFLRVRVVGQPHALRRLALFQLDVIEVGLRLDDGLVALGLEARRDEQHDRWRSGRRLGQRPRRHATDGDCRKRLRRLILSK